MWHYSGNMKIVLITFLALNGLTACSSHSHKESAIIHMDFCDFLNKIPDQPPSEPALFEKSLSYLFENANSKDNSDSTLEKYIKNNEFIRREIRNGYYRLNIIFYKKTSRTEALLKTRSSEYLDYCGEDIIAEYEWIKGKFAGINKYKEGVMEGTEDIQLDPVK